MEQHRHPFAAVDLARLDKGFAFLLAHAARSGKDESKTDARGEGLTYRERRLFHFGMFVGLGEWSMAGDTIGSLVDGGVITSSEAERALMESVLVKGLPVSVHLTATLAGRRLNVPANTMQAVSAVEASKEETGKSATGSEPKLSEREVFALGLGIAWGTRCWDT